MSDRCVRDVLAETQDRLEAVRMNLNCGVSPQKIDMALADLNLAKVEIEKARQKLLRMRASLQPAGGAR